MSVKKRRIQKEKLHKALADSFSPLRKGFKEKLRLKGKIRLLNMWARKNPKKIFISFLCAMAIIIIGDLLLSKWLNRPEMSPEVNMLNVSPIFNGMNRIENNRENIQLYLNSIIEEGLSLSQKLDSLQSIENKTPQDSANIKAAINRLNALNNILSNEP